MELRHSAMTLQPTHAPCHARRWQLLRYRVTVRQCSAKAQHACTHAVYAGIIQMRLHCAREVTVHRNVALLLSREKDAGDRSGRRTMGGKLATCPKSCALQRWLM